jgi:tetratricopeptide (TPR) repeat protein
MSWFGWLRQGVYAAFAVLILMLVPAAVGGDGAALTVLALGVPSLALVGVNRLRWQRLRVALRSGDAARARALWRRVYSRLDGRARQHPRVQLWRAYVSVLGGHYAPALAILEGLTRIKLSPREQAARDSLRARCLAQGNEPEAAIAVVEQARALPDLSSDTKRALTEALAIARLRMRQPELALSAVDELLSDPERSRARASHLLVRGDALRLIGREGEARAAYDEALHASQHGSMTWRRARERLDQPPPASQHGSMTWRRARERLDQPPPSAYR